MCVLQVAVALEQRECSEGIACSVSYTVHRQYVFQPGDQMQHTSCCVIRASPVEGAKPMMRKKIVAPLNQYAAFMVHVRPLMIDFMLTMRTDSA